MVLSPDFATKINPLKQLEIATRTQTLLQYLRVAFPTIPTQWTTPGPKNITNPQHDVDDMTQVVPWLEFNYSTVIQRYGQALNINKIQPNPLCRHYKTSQLSSSFR
jgi:hypothetical protein